MQLFDKQKMSKGTTYILKTGLNPISLPTEIFTYSSFSLV